MDRSGKISAVVLTVLVIIFAGLSGYLYMQNTGLENQVQNLVADKQSLQSKVQSLSNDKSNLQNQVSTLQSKVQQLTSDKETLQNKVTDLTNQNNKLKQDISSLQNQITNLNSQISTLQSIISLNIEKQLYKSETFNLPSRTYTEYSLSPDHAGYLYLHFTATNNITISIDGYYQGSYYHMEWGLANGDLVIPVLPGTVSLYFTNYHYFTSVTITFDLIYVY